MVTRDNRGETDAVATADELRELLRARTLEVAELRQKLSDIEARGTSFLRAASHAVMNPLTIIQTYLEIIHSDLRGGLSDQQAGFVETAHAAALRMHRLIDDLVELAAFELDAVELEKDAVRVGEVVSDLCASYRQAAVNGGIDFAVSIAPELPRVQADPLRLRNAVDAVVSNAVRLTPRGGKIHVTVSRSDDCVVINVRDTGPGIPGDRLEEVFDPFVRLSRSNGEPPGGAGLGLSLARRQIEAIGGHVEVSSIFGDGSSFSIAIPAMTEQS